MDVAIPFKNHYKLNDKVQEFNIFFDPDKNNFDTLIEFIQTFDRYRINIQYRNGIDTKTASALAKVSDRVFFRLKAEDVPKVSRLTERGCKFFFDTDIPAGNWSTLVWLVERNHVTDVYPSDDLMYELDKVRDYCTEHDVNIRMVVNRAPTTYTVSKEDSTALIYRPQDMPVLNDYIDTIEFDCGDPYNFNKAKVLYKAYVTKEYWYGQLGEINPDFDSIDLPCPSIPPSIAAKRSVCGRRCIRGGSCHTCGSLLQLGRSLRDIGARLRQQ